MIITVNLAQDLFSMKHRIKRVMSLVLLKNRNLQYHIGWAAISCVLSTLVKTEEELYVLLIHFLENAFPKVNFYGKSLNKCLYFP